MSARLFKPSINHNGGSKLIRFKRSIGTLALIATALGGIVGSGWLFGPLFAAQAAGPAAILSWVIGGVLMGVIALNFAELSTALPITGGMVRFVDFSFGPIMSFTIGWLVWLSGVVVAPVETLALIQYAANYIPGLMNEQHLLSLKGISASAIVMFLMVWLNFYGVKFFSRTTLIVTSIKLIVPILVSVVLLTMHFDRDNFVASGGFMSQGWHGILAALPLGGIVYSFIGYSSAIEMAGEVKNPQRAIPLAVFGSIIFCIVLYVLLQIAFIGALPSNAFAHGWEHLSFSGDMGPFSGILTMLGVLWLVIFIYSDAVISPFGTGYIYTAATARVNCAMVESGFFPLGLKKLNKFGVPARALWFNYGIGLIFFLPFPGWQSMMTFIISCFIISFIIGPIALMTLRYTHPDLPRTFKLPAMPFFTISAFYFSNLLVYWTGWDTVYKLMIAIAVGLGWFFYRYYRGKIVRVTTLKLKSSMWLLPYLLGITVISYLGSFGGGIGYLPFGMDFIVIAVFSLSIFFWAVKEVRNADLTHTVDLLQNP